MSPQVHTIAVVGAGAVGSYFGALLARAGHAVTLIGRAAHVQAIHDKGLVIERRDGRETFNVAASTAMDAVRDADLVLCCVKSIDTAAAALALAPLLRRDALVFSLQNGVDNADTLAQHIAPSQIVAAAVYVAAAMPAAGVIEHHGRGDLVIGALAPEASAQLPAIAERFAAAGIPTRASDDVFGELWTKLLLNCAYNAISALVQLPYGRVAALAPVRELMRNVVHEVVAVAQAAGRPMALDAALAACERIAAAMPAQFSSTAQDLARRKPSEIEHLNGFIVRRGAELGVATPTNQALYALVKLAESAFGGSA